MLAPLDIQKLQEPNFLEVSYLMNGFTLEIQAFWTFRYFVSAHWLWISKRLVIYLKSYSIFCTDQVFSSTKDFSLLLEFNKWPTSYLRNPLTDSFQIFRMFINIGFRKILWISRGLSMWFTRYSIFIFLEELEPFRNLSEVLKWRFLYDRCNRSNLCIIKYIMSKKKFVIFYYKEIISIYIFPSKSRKIAFFQVLEGI